MLTQELKADVDRYPSVRFVSDHVRFDGDRLTVSGRLEAAGKQIPLGMLRAPSTLIVRGHLVREEGV